jgi:hypothetical protein
MGPTDSTSITANGHTRRRNVVGVYFLVGISLRPSNLTDSYNVHITRDLKCCLLQPLVSGSVFDVAILHHCLHRMLQCNG